MVESVEAAQPAPAPESSPSSPRKPPKRKTSDLSFPIESKRPKSPTLLLACKHVGTSRDALVQREPEDAHALPSDVLRMRKEHQERRRQYLVELVRRKYWELKSAVEKQQQHEEQRQQLADSFRSLAETTASSDALVPVEDGAAPPEALASRFLWG